MMSSMTFTLSLSKLKNICKYNLCSDPKLPQTVLFLIHAQRFHKCVDRNTSSGAVPWLQYETVQKLGFYNQFVHNPGHFKSQSVFETDGLYFPHNDLQTMPIVWKGVIFAPNLTDFTDFGLNVSLLHEKQSLFTLQFLRMTTEVVPQSLFTLFSHSQQMSPVDYGCCAWWHL